MVYEVLRKLKSTSVGLNSKAERWLNKEPGYNLPKMKNRFLLTQKKKSTLFK